MKNHTKRRLLGIGFIIFSFVIWTPIVDSHTPIYILFDFMPKILAITIDMVYGLWPVFVGFSLLLYDTNFVQKGFSAN